MAIYIVRKKFITLIEIMIVMFLIALITGVLAYNYRGSLEQGKVFKTKAAMEKLETILNLAVAQDPQLLDDIDQESKWHQVLEQSPIVSNPRDLEVDGWGKPYRVEVHDGQIKVTSEGLSEQQKGSK